MFDTPSVQAPVAPVPQPVVQKQASMDFNDFQKPTEPQKPVKEDAWAKGSKLFDLSNLKKDQELKNQQFADLKLESKHHDFKQDDGWGKYGQTQG